MADPFVEAGLAPAPGLPRDVRWWIALVAALPVVAALRWLVPGPPAPALGVLALSSVVLLQPVIEELLFRGLLQGRLLATRWGTRRVAGISAANAATSIAFATLHLWQHTAPWAAAVLVPSLVFGFFRERHASVVPAILLHVAYNACYFLGQRLNP